LVTAVAPVVIKGKGLWVGWPGIHLPPDFNDEDIPESDPSDQTPTAGLKSEQVKWRNLENISELLIE
jgi:trehalose 6-phosphate synthase/phosphatase